MSRGYAAAVLLAALVLTVALVAEAGPIPFLDGDGGLQTRLIWPFACPGR